MATGNLELPAISSNDAIAKMPLTAAIFVAKIWKPPNISESNADRNAREEEVQLVSPAATLIVLVLVLKDVVLDVALWIGFDDLDFTRIDDDLRLTGIELRNKGGIKCRCCLINFVPKAKLYFARAIYVLWFNFCLQTKKEFD